MRKTTNTTDAVGCLLLLLSLPFGALWSGFVLSILWGWFIVPTFEIRPLGVLPAIGVSMVVGYLTKQEAATKDERGTTERVAYLFGHMFIYPLFALVFGWILHSFM